MRLKNKEDIYINRLIDDADHLYSCLNRPLPALRKIEKVLQRSPNNVDGLVIKGRILFQLDRVREAEKCYKQAISFDSKCTKAILERARILFALRKENKKALVEVKKALDLATRKNRGVMVEGMSLQGDILAELGREKEALSSYRAALKLDPINPETHGDLAETLLGLGKPSKALTHFNIALKELRKKKYQNKEVLELIICGKVEALNALGRHRESLKILKYALKNVKGENREVLKVLLIQTQGMIKNK